MLNLNAPDVSPVNNHDGFLWRKRGSVDPDGAPPKLAPAESYWMAVKAVCFLVLGWYNVLFFDKHTQGVLTIVTCTGAVFLEISGFFCVLWWNRTSQLHRKWLMIFGGLFLSISLFHATLGYYDMNPGGGWIGRVAFPLIFFSLMAASIVIPMKHWERESVQQQIDNEIKLEKEISNMQTQLLTMQAETRFQDARSVLLSTQLEQRRQHMATVREMVEARQAEKDYIWSIEDPEIRSEAQRLIDNQKGSVTFTPLKTPQGFNLTPMVEDKSLLKNGSANGYPH